MAVPRVVGSGGDRRQEASAADGADLDRASAASLSWPDVATAALTDGRHVGQIYELTGPRPLTFADAAAEISKAAGREIRYLPISLEEFAQAAEEQEVPKDVIEMLSYLFGEVFDGRNAHLAEGVQRAIGREPRDFTDYARDAPASGVWDVA
jgi:uncharacterized protein YbjT (DUF2867 family)